MEELLSSDVLSRSMLKSNSQTSRIIGQYSRGQDGPLLIAIGGIHGNEPAGVLGIERILELLCIEPTYNPSFIYNGTFVGLRGNLAALKAKKRYIDTDMNRLFKIDHIAALRRDMSQARSEDRELIELLDTIDDLMCSIQHSRVIFLDIHTTTAHGGIFSIPQDNSESVTLGLNLHAPVIQGMNTGLAGTTMHYFTKQNFGPFTNGVCFEAGQHDDAESVDNAVSAIVNCMRSIGAVAARHAEQKHDDRLLEYSKQLPTLCNLLYTHHIKPQDSFVMNPDFVNFQPVTEGDLLAQDKHGEVRAPMSGFMLMPLYQAQGEDGFFIIESLEGY